VQRNAYYLSTFLGRWDEALQRATKATELDPLSAANFERLGFAQTSVHRFAEAESAYRKSLNLNPNSDGLHSLLAQILWYQGRKSEAEAENERETDAASRLAGQAYFQLKLGRATESTQALDTYVRKYGRSRPFNVGTLYADLGRIDDAFRWWGRAVTERDVQATYLLAATRDPDLAGIDSDPRFKALVKQMKLPVRPTS
jgi:tetratricopeptide (TPR) repeat protein